jgi:hypothetical protein
MKTFVKKLFGIDKLEKERAEAEALALLAKEGADRAKQEEEQAKMTPKERATAKGEPYVAVLETHVNKDNLRNGFFELDWNDEFVLQLKQAGYGFDGDPDEEIVDRWFRSLCRDIASEEGIDMTDRGAGYINVTKLSDGKSIVS